MSDKFNKIVQVILKHEGGYVNDPDDAGGETKYGISKESYPYLDIKNITEKVASDIYFEDYYTPLNCEKIEPIQLACHVMDMGVNAGIRTAAILLQSILNTKEDGVIGRNTITSIDNYKDKFELINKYKQARKDYYTTVSNKGNNKKFLSGWLKRVENCEL